MTQSLLRVGPMEAYGALVFQDGILWAPLATTVGVAWPPRSPDRAWGSQQPNTVRLSVASMALQPSNAFCRPRPHLWEPPSSFPSNTAEAPSPDTHVTHTHREGAEKIESRVYDDPLRLGFLPRELAARGRAACRWGCVQVGC